MLARVEIRRGWRTMVLFGVLAGLGLGVAVAAAQVARRTSTAYDRLERASGAPDVIVGWTADVDSTPVPDLPGVRRHWDGAFGIGQIETDEEIYLGVTAGPRRPRALRPHLVVRGRAARPGAAGEIVITEDLARETGLDVGDRLPMAFLTAEEFTQFDTGFGEPDGPRLGLRIVGVVRSILGSGDNAPGAFGTEALARRLRAAGSAYPATFLDLRDGSAGLAAFDRRLDAVSARAAPVAGAEEFTAYFETVPSASRGGYAVTARILVTGLLAFGGVAGLAGLVTAALALRRHFQLASSTERQALAAAGVLRRQLWGARVLAAVPFIAAAAGIAVAATLAGGAIGPIGSLARLEPHPGFHLDVGLAGGAVAVVVGVGVVATTLAAAPGGGRERARRPRASRVARGLSTAGAPPPVVIGAGVALEPGGGRTAGPVRPSLVATAVVLAALVGVQVFATSLDRLRSTPARWGWNGDLVVYDTDDSVLDEVAEDPDVRAVADATEFQVRVEGVAATAATVEPPALGWTVLDGRPPRASGEVMLGARLARTLDRGVGDRVAFRTADGTDVSLAVVGVGTGPRLVDGYFAGGLLVVPADVARVARTQEQHNAVVDFRADVESEPVTRRLASRYEVSGVQRPPDVENLSELGRLPQLLAGFLALFTVAVLAHSVVTTTRRRRRDLDTLRALGFVRRQAHLVVVVASVLSVAVALAAGIVAGMVGGAAVWRFTARSAYVAPDLAPSWAPLLVITVGALLVAVAVAVVPAVWATRRPVAEGLRVE